jgi:hypothetical protein
MAIAAIHVVLLRIPSKGGRARDRSLCLRTVLALKAAELRKNRQLRGSGPDPELETFTLAHS